MPQQEMAPVSRLLFLFLIEYAGASVYQFSPLLYEPGEPLTSDYSNSVNASEKAEQRTVVAAAGTLLTASTLLVSLWSSIFTEKGIDIDISNQLVTSLSDPTWYMLHGHAVIIPPFFIKENEPSTVFQFEKLKDGTFGTEGVVSYPIGSPATLSLVVMWKVPQMLSNPSFFVRIEKSGKIPAKNLKTMFNDVDDKKLWFHVEKQHHWQTKKEEGLTWKAAMGTRSHSILKVVIMK